MAILILLAVVAALATLANRIRVPYPILLVLGGLVLGFVPGLPRVELEPEVVFLLFLPPLRERDPSPSSREVSIIAWTGMRGVISLAAALALPLTTNDETPFPGRDIILFLTFCVILVTLVAQGLSLPPLIRALGLHDDGSTEQEETMGRIEVAQATLNRIDELAEEDWVREDTAERVRGLYNYRRSRFAARFDGDQDGLEDRSAAYQRLLRDLLRVQRQTLIRLRDEGRIGDEAMHRIERDLDLEESRLEL
jgi:CPA1 family monovalent cation:H+ antiporter